MTTVEHLQPVSDDRGLRSLPPVAGKYGGAVAVFESSAASEPCIWLHAATPTEGAVHVHLTAEAAGHLAEQIEWLLEHHYQVPQ